MTIQDPVLAAQLTRIQRRWLTVRGLRAVLVGLLVTVSVLLAAGWLDLMFELPAYARTAAVVVAGALGVASLALVFIRGVRGATARGLALRMDQAGGTGGEILSGVDLDDHLAHQAATERDLPSRLAELSIRRAGQQGQRIDPAEAVSARPVWRAARPLLALGALLGLLTLVAPELVGTQLARLFDPNDDLPPFTRLVLEVEPGDVDVIYGQELDIRVTATGVPVDQLELVVRPDNGSPSETLPLFQETTEQWRTTLSRVTQPARYVVRAAAGRSAAYRLGVITVPQLEDVRFRVTPPDYTRSAAYEGRLPDGGLSGLAGTRIDVWARSNRPLGGGAVALTLADPTAGPGKTRTESIPLTPDDDDPEGHTVHGTFELTQPGRFQLAVRDIADVESQDAFGGSLTVLKDQRPFVRILEPMAMALATPEASLPVVVTAEDDYGIARMELYRSLNGSRPLAEPLLVPEDQPARHTASVTLPLSSYQLEPGDTIKLFARVEDTRPNDPQGAESGLVTVQIISQAEFDQMIRRRENLNMLLAKYREAQRRIEALKQAMEELQARADDASELAEQMQQAREQLRETAESLQQAIDRPLGYDLDQHLTDDLARLLEEVEQAQQKMDELQRLHDEGEISDQELAEKLAELADELGLAGETLQQQANDALEHLAKAFPLMADAKRFEQLVKMQRELAERSAALKDAENPDDPTLRRRLRELEEQQQWLREQLADLADDIRDHVEQLPPDEPFERLRESALEFLEALEASGGFEAMTDAATGFAEFSGPRGHANAKLAAERLEALLGQCDGMGQQCESCMGFSPKLANGLGNTLQQLLADMGLGAGSGSGSGSGIGSGSGYSAQAGGSQMSLYGNYPLMELGASTGRSNRDTASGGLAGRDGQPPATDQPDEYRDAAGGTLTGRAAAQVPAAYRQRVAEYFRRIAEETGP